MTTSRSLLAFALLAPLASGAFASTFTVDDDGPADFADIPAAISSPLVQDGDVLLVAPGIYTAGWTLQKALTIRGTGTSPNDAYFTTTGSTSTILGLPAGTTTTISNLRFENIDVESCAGTVVFTYVRALSLDLDGADDVRVWGLNHLVGAGARLRLEDSDADVSHANLAGLSPSPPIGGLGACTSSRSRSIRRSGTTACRTAWRPSSPDGEVAGSGVARAASRLLSGSRGSCS